MTEAPIKPADDGEIGDAEDLQDGETTKPDVDPEETSIWTHFWSFTHPLARIFLCIFTVTVK